MAGVNKVILVGNLGADPEVRQTPGGNAVATFSVAVTERWKDQSGQKQERTEWVRCVVWRRQAEIAQQYLRKGSKVYAEGKLQTRSWEDRNGGGKRYATEVILDTFQMLDAPNGQGGHGNQGGFGGNSQASFGDNGIPDFGPVGAGPAPTGPAPSEDDLPF